MALAQQGHFVESNGGMTFSGAVGCSHAQGMNGGEFSFCQSLLQLAFGEIVHQKTHGATVHAIDWNA